MSLRLFVFRVPISSLFLARNKFAHRASISTFLWSKSKNSCFVLGKKFIAVSSRNMSSGDKRKSSGSAAGESPSKKAKVENGAASSSQDGAGSEDFLQQIADRRTGVCESVAGFKFNKKRCRQMSDGGDLKQNCGGILYWMSRDQRVQDNWALLFAQRLAIKHKVPLYVCFCLVPKFLDATIRHYGFMLKGLEEVEKELTELDVSFHLLTGHAVDVLPEFVSEKNIGGVVTDFSPLRTPMKWVHDLAGKLPSDVPFVQVDAHNIVPCWEASPKQEYGARTIRNKIHNQLSSYLTEFPPVCKHPHPPKSIPEPTDWAAARASLKVDMSVAEVTWATPGTTGGLRQLESFCKQRLKNFGTDRNNPNKRALSNLSPWIHFGQISVQRCILTVKKYRSKYKESVDAYIEEAIIRRELSDNFCFYNHDKYDSIKGAAAWAQKTLKDHAGDKREYLYSREQLEQAKTHDDLWNAAQIQLNKEGKMHGFLRMYWAKKILEWTESPQVALKEAIYLNDKYSLDGRDPNGYVGCMWSICGIHDQGWAERPVFGKIRFMNYNGCKRKFDVAQFVTKYKAKGFLKK